MVCLKEASPSQYCSFSKMFGVINVVMQGWTGKDIKDFHGKAKNLQGGAGKGSKSAGQGICDKPFFSGSLIFAQESLEGGPECFLLLFVHQLITILTILLKESIPHFLMSYFMKRHSSEDISPLNK